LILYPDMMLVLNRRWLIFGGFLFFGLLLSCFNAGTLSPQRDGQLSGPFMAVVPQLFGVMTVTTAATLILQNMKEAHRGTAILITGIALTAYCLTHLSIQNCQVVNNGTVIQSFIKIIGPEHIIQLQYLSVSITTIGITYLHTIEKGIRKE